MALIALSTMSSTTPWAVPALVAAGTSNTFAMPSGPGLMFACFRNTGTAKTVTVDLPSTYTDAFGRAITDITGASNLAATTGEMWIPLYPQMADSTGIITITVDVATAVTVSCVRIV